MKSMGTRVVLAITGVAVLALLVGEATMQPSSQDRAILIGIFAGVAALVAVAAGLLDRWTSRLASLHTAVLIIAVAAVAAAAVAILASAASMFISGHDLRLVLVALGFGVALGVVLATALSSRLAADLRSIGRAAQEVADGRRDVTTGVDRADEVGAVARALDDLVRRLAAAEAEQARMEHARRRFLAAISHDLRTPLTSLRVGLEALQDGMASDPARYLTSMQGDVTLLGSLVDDLFLLARIESGGLEVAPERVDLAELVDEAVEALQPIAQQRGVKVAADAPTPVVALAMPREIGRVLRNLIDNATRHADAAVTVRLDRQDGRARLEVSDDGPGFPSDFVAVALQSFTRADDARRRDGSGAGLGLAIADGLVRAHGGQITIEPGPGGHVIVDLPALAAP